MEASYPITVNQGLLHRSLHFISQIQRNHLVGHPIQIQYLDSKDYSKLDEEYKHLIRQQIAKIQHSRAEAEKQNLLEKEKKVHQDAIAYFEKLEEEKNVLKKKAKMENVLAKEAEENKIQEAKEKQKVLELKIQ